MTGSGTGAENGVRFLEDVRVLEIANLAPTQLGMHLADLGAEIIKIEPPKKGDATRLIALQPGFKDSSLHRRWNRGKKSIALDTTTPAGAEILRGLIRETDILIEGLRPGALEKMGFGWSELTALKPNLVMVALSGYGQGGPNRDLPSHGLGFDSVSGLAPPDLDERGRPRIAARNQVVHLGTIFAPLFGAASAVSALTWSRRTGRPVFLDVAQADAAAFANLGIEMMASQKSREAARLASAPSPNQHTYGTRSGGDSASMQYYRTRDDKVLLVMALERKFFERLVEAVDRPDLLDHVDAAQYVTVLDDNDAVRDVLVEAIGAKDLDEWMKIFADADVPVVPVNDNAQTLDDPQFNTRFEWMPADQGTVTMKTPVRSEPRTAAPSQAPAIGQHTTEILARIGVDPAEIEQLERDGVIRLGPADSND